MKLDIKIATKYIFNGKINLISIITFISIIGITVGVAALIIVLSIFNGFRNLSENQLLSFEPHIRIIPKNNVYFDDMEKLLQKLSEDSRIKLFSPALSTKIVLKKSNNIQVANLLAYSNPNYIKELSKKFYSSIHTDFSTNGIYIGYGLANRLQVGIDENINILSAKNLERAIQTMQFPKSISVKNSGHFNSNVKDYDLTLVLSNIDIAKQVLSLKRDRFSQIDIKLFNNSELNSVLDDLEDEFPNLPISFLTWIDLNKDLYYIMQFERVAVFSILSLILLIAIFNVFASLAMTIVKKKSDIAILKSIGGTEKFIRKIFIKEGFIIGITGTLLGLILSLIIIFVQEKFGIFAIDGSKYIINKIPMTVNIFEVVFVSFFSVCLAGIATIFPAKKAAKSDIIKSIRID